MIKQQPVAVADIYEAANYYSDEEKPSKGKMDESAQDRDVNDTARVALNPQLKRLDDSLQEDGN